MNNYLIAYIVSIVISVLFHLYAGYDLRKRFKKINKYEEMMNYYRNVHLRNKKKAEYLLYLIYAVPVLNVLFSLTELAQMKKTFFSVIEQMDDYNNQDVEEHFDSFRERIESAKRIN